MYFYKGEFTEYNPNDPDEVYIWLSSKYIHNEKCMIICIFGTYNNFKFCKPINSYYVIFTDVKHPNTSYCEKLCLYINRYCDELLHHDKEAFTNLVNIIKETYDNYRSMCDNLGNKFKGGSNIKSAK